MSKDTIEFKINVLWIVAIIVAAMCTGSYLGRMELKVELAGICAGAK